MAEEKQENSEQQFAIQKIYTKDVSFESPNSPAIFSNGDWQPEINVQLNSVHQNVGEDTYEVVLSVTVTAKHQDKTAFLVEVKQAGVFAVSGFTEEALAGMLGAYCPETLFPFAREAVADFVNKGGFPQLLIAPVNFNALYTQHMQQQASGTAEDTAH
jgi:preprotein translocase subunit SecB